MKWKRQRKKAKETKTWILSDQHNSRPHLLQVDHGEKKSQTSAWYKKDINNKQNPIRLRNEDVIFPNKISIHQPDNIIQLYVIWLYNYSQMEFTSGRFIRYPSRYFTTTLQEGKIHIQIKQNKANPRPFQCISSKKTGVCKFVQTWRMRKRLTAN